MRNFEFDGFHGNSTKKTHNCWKRKISNLMDLMEMAQKKHAIVGNEKVRVWWIWWKFYSRKKRTIIGNEKVRIWWTVLTWCWWGVVVGRGETPAGPDVKKPSSKFFFIFRWRFFYGLGGRQNWLRFCNVKTKCFFPSETGSLAGRQMSRKEKISSKVSLLVYLIDGRS